MAKKQTFGDKIDGKNTSNTFIKLIRSCRSDKTGALRFNEEMIQVPDGKNADAIVKKLLSNKAWYYNNFIEIGGKNPSYFCL